MKKSKFEKLSNWPSEEEEGIIGYINNKLSEPAKPQPEDLDIKLPPGRTPGEYYCGLLIEEIKPKYTRPMPQPPYRCICGIVFKTAEELLAHRHHNMTPFRP